MEIKGVYPSYDDYVRGVRFLKIDEQLTLLEIILTRFKKNISKKRKKNSILDLEGLGSELWNDVDAQEHVHKERDSWA